MRAPGQADHPAAATVHALRERLESTLDPLLAGSTRCVLTDFPDYPNVGDSAIWLGQLAYLRSRRIRIAYACDQRSYSRVALARRLGDGVILLQGGGNLGDLWPGHQHFRERIIADFPDRRIIQLPQTIHFRDPANLERARAVFDRHPDLTVLVRDRQSLETAQRHFRARSALCPDMTLGLGPLAGARVPARPILWLARADVESCGGSDIPIDGDVLRTDWPPDGRLAIRGGVAVLRRLLRWYPRRLMPLTGPLLAAYHRLARQRLDRGCRLLGESRVVITDRLHGYLLSLLLGLPHVVLDNSYGKVRGFWETWTRDCPLTHWADSPAAALETARRLSASGG